MESNDKKLTLEELKLLEEELKKNSKRINLLDNKNLRKFLADKRIDFFGSLERQFIRFILLTSISVKSFDERFQKIDGIDHSSNPSCGLWFRYETRRRGASWTVPCSNLYICFHPA